jgi:hypothetical protein
VLVWQFTDAADRPDGTFLAAFWPLRQSGRLERCTINHGRHLLAGHTASVLTSLITGVVALVGVVVGVALEPVKAAVAHRAQLHRDRMDRCAALIIAATNTRALLLAINRLNRRRATGETITETEQAETVGLYRSARAELRQAVALFHLWGPQSLIEAADSVLAADRALRATRYDVGAADAPVGEEARPEAVAVAASALEAEIRRFGDVARVADRQRAQTVHADGGPSYTETLRRFGGRSLHRPTG